MVGYLEVNVLSSLPSAKSLSEMEANMPLMKPPLREVEYQLCF